MVIHLRIRGLSLFFYNTNNPHTTNYGLETLRNFSPKIWEILPDGIKAATSRLQKQNKEVDTYRMPLQALHKLYYGIGVYILVFFFIFYEILTFWLLFFTFILCIFIYFILYIL